MTRVPGNRRFNERPSPPVVDRKLQALQVLASLRRRFPATVVRVCAELGFEPDDLDEIRESLTQELIEADVLTECGCCGCYHRPDFAGDCRNDDERFP